MPFRPLVLAFVLTFALVHAANPTVTQERPDAAAKPGDTAASREDEAVVKLEAVDVSAQQEAFANSIDRKVYNVGKDIQSLTGSASDLMQNIPSVQVDVEGNVRLRGSDSVLILIDGKSSTLMGKNRAAALEQMPADSIDKIEVITNPSAKYKPDGTAGIINIVRKRKHVPGFSGALRTSIGNAGRYSAGITGNVEKGKANFAGSYSIRQDNRERFSDETRSHLDPATGMVIVTEQHVQERQRPLSHIAQGGVEYTIDAENKIGATGSYNHRGFTRTGTDVSESREGSGALTSDYSRDRVDPEFEQDVEWGGTYQHSFADEGHELNLEVKAGRTTEQEDNHYTTNHRAPAGPPTYDNVLVNQLDRDFEAIAEYNRPLPNQAKLETGYTFESEKNDMDFLGSSLDPASGRFVRDPVVSNRFIYTSRFNSLYGTYGRPIHRFGFLGGVRFEDAVIHTNQVTARLLHQQNYFSVYPTLHLTYNLTDTQQLQLNYSRRVHRPEGDDLNPYPEYQDPYNLRAGNPALRPEDTHSIEAGYQYHNGDTTYLATVYYRKRTNSITDVTRFIDSMTLLTTKENLSTNRSGGLEVAATTEFAGKLSLNASANGYYNEIDASNLGFSASRSTVTWEGKLNASYHWSKTTLLQLNTNYTARRLTPQGNRLPSFVANVGVRYELKPKKLALIGTISDALNTLKEETVINTPLLQRETVRRRNSRTLQVGLIYTFGKPAKKSKDDSLQFDDKP